MKTKIGLVIFLTLLAGGVFARLVQSREPKTLMADAKLVFVGRVRSVQPSGIVTKLGYPTWGNVVFEWLATEVQVLEPFKGVKAGDTVKTLMLSQQPSKEIDFMYSPPGMLFPNPGDVFFFCLGPTPVTNAFAALTAPYDDDFSIIALHRQQSASSSNGQVRDNFLLKEKSFELISRLVDGSGKLIPENVKALRKTFVRELKKKPSKELVYLKWESLTNAAGWSSDFPKK